MEETLKGGGMIIAQPETPTRIPANGSYYTSVKGTPIFTPDKTWVRIITRFLTTAQHIRSFSPM